MARRLSFAFAALAFVLIAALRPSGPAAAAGDFTISVTPIEEPVPVGGQAIFQVRVEGDTLHLPTFHFGVVGGTLSGVSSINPTAAHLAEGAVFVTRDSEGLAKLTVSLDGRDLAESSARFARVASIAITVTLESGPGAAARTWRYEVLSEAGEVVDARSLSASGDTPRVVIETRPLPLGTYAVRQVASADLRTTCAGGAFYQLVSPASGERVVSLKEGTETVDFTIRPCAPPALGGDGRPASDVQGAREAGTLSPLPPRTGDGSHAEVPDRTVASLVLLLAGGLMTLVPPAAWVATRGRARR